MIKNLIQNLFSKFGYKILNLKKDKSNLDQFLKVGSSDHLLTYVKYHDDVCQGNI